MRCQTFDVIGLKLVNWSIPARFISRRRRKHGTAGGGGGCLPCPYSREAVGAALYPDENFTVFL